jgi:hypothetical protein
MVCLTEKLAGLKYHEEPRFSPHTFYYSVFQSPFHQRIKQHFIPPILPLLYFSPTLYHTSSQMTSQYTHAHCPKSLPMKPPAIDYHRQLLTRPTKFQDIRRIRPDQTGPRYYSACTHSHAHAVLLRRRHQRFDMPSRDRLRSANHTGPMMIMQEIHQDVLTYVRSYVATTNHPKGAGINVPTM